MPYITGVDEDGKRIVSYIDYPVLSPRLIFETLFQRYPNELQKLIAGGPESFWEKVLPDDPKLADNPMVDIPNWTQLFLPVVIFGDHAPYTKLHSLSVLCWKFLESSGPLWHRIFLSIAFPKACAATFKKDGVDTWSVFWQFMSFEWNSLFLGFHHARNGFGQLYTDSLSRKLVGQALAGGRFRLCMGFYHGSRLYMQ